MESSNNAVGPSTTGPSILPNDPRLARCGFAKLQGDGIEFFVRKYEITIGRTSKNSTLDLILGDSTTISRQHASIRYNFDTKCFELVVLGKNGVTVESSGNGTTHLYTPDSPPTPLRSRDMLIMGEKRFYFLLPRAMGGQSRKRRRLEPSPAPGPLIHPAGPAGGAIAPAQHLHNTQPPLSSAPKPSNPHLAQQPHPSSPSAVAAPAATGPAGGVPISGAQQPPSHHGATQPQQPQATQKQSPQKQKQPAHANTHQRDSTGEPGADLAVQQSQQQPCQMQQDEDALIDASAIPYDNGAPYGYGGGSF